MQEKWIFYKTTYNKRDGYKQYYVSNFGRVMMNGELYECTIVNGYYYLCHRPLHRIIAELFILGCNKNYEIDHKDCNKLNNMVTNLLVCQDHKQNMNNPLTIKHNRESKPSKSILQYTLDNIFVAEYLSSRGAERETKISQSSIVKCCKNKRKSAGGYIWKYKED